VGAARTQLRERLLSLRARVTPRVAGPLRLLDGDFPDREFMQEIAEGNLLAALALLPQDTTHA
jgi:hypothetical protein